ncbi:MAG: hypothetical protein H7061_05285 [Bdellovibrionaceae bacterium]|nr:hypothetical protein [Bdellovibrio sp.]
MKLVKSFALIFLLTVLIVSFQNCTVRQNTGLLGKSTDSQSVNNSIVEKAPFAFDVVVDTISYNSCSGDNLNNYGNPGLHGLKIGVNEGFFDATGAGGIKAGAKLRSEFLRYVGKNLTPNYPATVITPGQIQYVLAHSTVNSDSFIQFAVRKKSDLSVVLDQIQPANSVLLPGRDGYVEPASLKSDEMLTELSKSVMYGPGGVVLSEGPFVYNLHGKTEPKPIMTSFSYVNAVDETFAAVTNADDSTGAGEQYADQVRKRFNSGGSDQVILAVTYGNPNASGVKDQSLNDPKRSDLKEKSKAFGRGYELKFETNSAKAGWKENLLKFVTETNLSKDGSLGIGNWSCENFVIMKQSHWNNAKPDEAGCAPLIATDMQNAAYAIQIKKLRRHYSESEWNIGVFYGKGAGYQPNDRTSHALCLVPKVKECYLPTVGLTTDGADIGVQYDATKECYLSRFSFMGVSYSGAAIGDNARKLGRCAQYASICIRN